MSKDSVKKVALFSNKNLHWREVGELKMGYNIVTEDKAERWLSHNSVRKASPEEVASAYGR